MRAAPITDAELPIMRSLWARGRCTSPEIFKGLTGNISTLKTLLMRLVQKGAVRAEEINQRNYRYEAVITEEEYINNQRRNFLARVFEGSTERMLLNFVREEKISAEELRRLVEIVEKA